MSGIEMDRLIVEFEEAGFSEGWQETEKDQLLLVSGFLG